MAILHQKACFRGRTRDSGTQSQIAAGSMWHIFGGPARRIWSAGSEITTLENHFVKNHFLINISNLQPVIEESPGQMPILMQKRTQRGRITQGKYPGGVLLLLDHCLIGNPDALLGGVHKWTRGWPGLKLSAASSLKLPVDLKHPITYSYTHYFSIQ